MTTLTTRQAAELAGTTPDRFRAVVSDARRRHGVELQAPKDLWPDARTPLYDAEALRRYLDER